MNFFPQPYVAPSESASLGAKQGHAKSAKRNHFSASSFLKFRIPHFAFPNKILPFRPLRPLRPLREQSAFSLTEVVIAMGVAAVAFTSIIALFPLGLNMSKESYEATQAAVIAQSIMADLSDQASAGSGKLIQKTGTNAMSAANYETIQLMAASGGTDRYIYLAYDQQIRTDSSNSPVMLRPSASFVSLNGPADPNWFTRGTNGPILLVKVSLKHSFRMSAAGTANPQRVDITIESPASAPATNRVQYVFSGVIPQN
jgi:type II secretory pathway pseudopilin PulG